MFPNQPNQNNGPAPYSPPVQPQQNTQGSYDVVPPIAAGVNSGHSGHNPYEFIVNPNTVAKKRGLFGGNGFVQKIVVIVAGAVILMVAAAVILNLVLPNTSGTASLTGIIQQQQEIARIAAVGASKGTSQATLNFATTVQASLASAQTTTTGYAESHGLKLNKKTLELGKNGATDTALSTAIATNTFDATFTETMTTQLRKYETSLQAAYKDTSRQELKKLLAENYNSATLLLKQASR